ncbi:putative helicase A859L [Emericellopsis atlantica]|uniref:Helicase A859L n=1 Tax=Emericellopsis atlantica TaxID=2614577 RepID=A0A9P7ZF04_9HYPO|nr:putative helicase A859L [Emericellopsis atlantica]KAG9250612.1 putative helicase A859L [Emericellopsis atlantica]
MMPQSEGTMAGLSPGDFPSGSPNTSLPATTCAKISPGKNAETAKATPITDDAILEEVATIVTEKPLKVRPMTQTKRTVSDLTVELPDTEESIVLQTWNKALSLDEGRCGAPTKSTKNIERCMIKIAPSRTTEIQNLIKMLRRLNHSPRQVERHLDDLAKLVHCHWHDHPPIRDIRIDEWLAALPDSPRTPTLERRLRTILGPAPSKCASLTKLGKPCRNSVKREDQYFCGKTISKMVQIATVASDDDTLDDLAPVLRRHMLCHMHQKYTPTYQDEYASAINKFQAACQHERKRRETENAIAETNNTGEGNTAALMDSGSHALITPPSSPKTLKVSRNPRNYWKEGFDMSPFDVLGKNDIVEKYKTPNEMIRRVAEDLLDTNPKPSKNEVANGYLYSFRVPGNERFVKIGFTTREGETRIEEWKRNCNRDPEILYLATNVVPHAHRVEKLVHAELMEHRVRIYCERCGKQHIEWFEAPEAIVIASLKKWSLWMAGKPYEKKHLEWHLRENYKKRLHDVGKFLKDLQEGVEAAELENQIS